MDSVKEYVRCDFKGCTEIIEYNPYFFDYMGFSAPKKCKECRDKLKPTCAGCDKTVKVTQFELKVGMKYAQKNGKKGDFVCQICREEAEKQKEIEKNRPYTCDICATPFKT